MAVTQVATAIEPDSAPLWLPRDEAVAVEQATVRQPDRVEGYNPASSLMMTLAGSPWKTATSVATAVAALLFIVVLPSLRGAGIGSLIAASFYQSWTLLILLLVSSRVRSIGVGTVARFWLAGMFTATIVTYFVSGPIESLVGSGSSVWAIPLVEELIKAVPLFVAVFMGRRVWRHPGLSDLVVLGFAVGGGFGFHAGALTSSQPASGLGLHLGLFVPSMYRVDGSLVVGHAVWTALVGLVIGLVVLHRHQAFAALGAAVLALVVLGDHMSINDGQGTLDVVRQLLFNGKLVALVFVVAVAIAFVVDQRRLLSTGARDHLFPSERALRAKHIDPEPGEDLVMTNMSNRYRRRRNGVHTTIDADTQQWPPRSEAHPAPVAELARLGRAADVAVGPGSSSMGWAPDPETPGHDRFVGPGGFTAYVCGPEVVPLVVAAPSPPTPVNGDDLPAAAGASPTNEPLLTATSISTPKARPEAHGTVNVVRRADYLQYVGLGVVAIGVYVLIRLVTAADPSTAVVAINLADAANSPALIRSVLGALAAGVAIRGRDQAVLGAGWSAGPGEDPIPVHPGECEA